MVCGRLAGKPDRHYPTASDNSALLFFGEFICLLMGFSSTAGSHPASLKHVGQSSGLDGHRDGGGRSPTPPTDRRTPWSLTVREGGGWTVW